MQYNNSQWPQLYELLDKLGLVLKTLNINENLPAACVVIDHDGYVIDRPNVVITLSAAPWDTNSQGRQDQILSSIYYLAPSLARFAQQGPFRLRFDFDDAGSMGTICMDRPCGSDWLLIPDRYLLDIAQHPPQLTSKSSFQEEFLSRKPIIFWRGSTTGGSPGCHVSEPVTSPEQLMRNYRVAACLAISRMQLIEADCKISNVVQLNGGMNDSDAWEVLRCQNVVGEKVGEEAFAAHQMTLDLPGNVAAWGACRKYLSGCLVLKPPQDRELVYTRLLQPWIHYLPLAADLSDLRDRLDWVRNYQSEAACIAWNGREQLIDILDRVPAMLQDAFRAGNEFKAAH